MTEHKHPDEDVISDLRSVAEWFKAHGRNTNTAVIGIAERALDIINRQRARIKALEMDNAQLQSDIINANQNSDHIKGLWEAEKEKVEKAKQKVVNACKMLKTARAEAYKEFAERLEIEFIVNGIYAVIVKNTIHRVVKEMTGGDQMEAEKNANIQEAKDT